jgi:hypothetical protein
MELRLTIRSTSNRWHLLTATSMLKIDKLWNSNIVKMPCGRLEILREVANGVVVFGVIKPALWQSHQADTRRFSYSVSNKHGNQSNQYNHASRTDTAYHASERAGNAKLTEGYHLEWKRYDPTHSQSRHWVHRI